MWQRLVTHEAEWKTLTTELFFIESVTDRSAQSKFTEDAIRVLAYACATCDRAFASQKALECHRRVKHGDRLDLKRFIAGSTCPACGTDYRDRLRCLQHLSDRRRPLCATWVRANVAPLPAFQVAKLDEVDRALRRDARRKGHTHHISILPALRSDGSIVGRLSS